MSLRVIFIYLTPIIFFSYLITNNGQLSLMNLKVRSVEVCRTQTFLLGVSKTRCSDNLSLKLCMLLSIYKRCKLIKAQFADESATNDAQKGVGRESLLCIHT